MERNLRCPKMKWTIFSTSAEQCQNEGQLKKVHQYLSSRQIYVLKDSHDVFLALKNSFTYHHGLRP